MAECIFGWGKQHGTMRKTKHRGPARVAADFLLNLIALQSRPDTQADRSIMQQIAAPIRAQTWNQNKMHHQAKTTAILPVFQQTARVSSKAAIELIEPTALKRPAITKPAIVAKAESINSQNAMNDVVGVSLRLGHIKPRTKKYDSGKAAGAYGTKSRHGL